MKNLNQLPSDDAEERLAQLRQLVLGDASWAAQLADILEPGVFAARLARDAGARGLAVTARQIGDALRGDPLGLSRFAAGVEMKAQWPPPGWLPVHVNFFGRPTVDWSFVGARPTKEPFFEGTVREALSRPFNQLIPYRMALSDFVADAPRHAGTSLMPTGLIFHMSRCGSTLVSQMLAQSSNNIVISEAAPIDAAVKLSRAAPPRARSSHEDLLRAFAIAYGRRHGSGEQRLFIKLDSWHAMALPLFTRVFPDVPWVFLYRDPVEVLVSQAREPGPQMARQIMPPALYGLDASATEPDLDYTARVLGTICNAAVDALASPQGLAINYRDLPDAVETRVLPHFGVSPDAVERAAMCAATGFDAKMPTLPFTTDDAAKQAAAAPALRDLADRTLRDVIGRLDAIAATPRAPRPLL